MISKELLGKVLDDEEIKEWIYETKIEDNIVSFCGGHREISIYELSYKCKEWAYNNNYIIEVKPFRVILSHRITGKTIKFQYDNKDRNPYLPKYELKACQWILDNKKEGN